MGLGPEMADMTAGGGLEVGRGGATAVCCRIPGGSREAEFSTAAPGLVTGWVGSLGMPFTTPPVLPPLSSSCCCCCKRAAAVAGD